MGICIYNFSNVLVVGCDTRKRTWLDKISTLALKVELPWTHWCTYVHMRVYSSVKFAQRVGIVQRIQRARIWLYTHVDSTKHYKSSLNITHCTICLHFRWFQRNCTKWNGKLMKWQYISSLNTTCWKVGQWNLAHWYSLNHVQNNEKIRGMTTFSNSVHRSPCRIPRQTCLYKV